MTKSMYFILAAIILLIAIASAKADGVLTSECTLHHRHHGASIDCQTYELPEARTRIIHANPAPQELVDAVCKPRVVRVDELGVEYVEYDNPKCRSGE